MLRRMGYLFVFLVSVAIGYAVGFLYVEACERHQQDRAWQLPPPHRCWEKPTSAAD